MSPPASHRHIVICSSIAYSGFSRGGKKNKKTKKKKEAAALRAESRVRPQPFPHLEPPCDGEEEEEEGCEEVSAVRGAERIRDFFFFYFWFFTS